MQKFVLIFSIVFSFISVQAQTETPAQQEALKISTQVVKLFKEKKFAEALPLAQKVVSIREKELGKNHLLVAQSLRNLAYIQLQLKKDKEAEESFRNAFEIYEKNTRLSAADEKMYAEILEVVAFYEAVDIDIIGAEKKLKRAIELNEKLSGKDSIETAGSLLKLAQLYQLKGDNEKAAPILLRALDIQITKLGTSDRKTYDAYQNTYCLLNKLERKDEAEKLLNKFYPKQDSGVGETERTVAEDKNTSVKGGVVNSSALNLAKPIYPLEARSKRITGSVNVQVTINEEGEVTFACALSGPKELQRASEIAAYQSKFTPTLLSGKPVRVVGVIVYNFVP